MLNVQPEIKNGYIIINQPNIDIMTKYVLQGIGMSYKEKQGIWKGRDDALKRAYLGIPIKKQFGQSIERVTFPPLMDFQREDIKKMVQAGKCLNANEMGLGKTLEAIIAAELLNVRKELIICPKSVRYNWIKEYQKWLNMPRENFLVIEGNKKQRTKLLNELNNADIVITNYETARLDDVAKELQKINWDLVILDEAHRIKNGKAKQTKVIKKIKSTYKFALTGTPIQNRPDDLWSILHWIDPFFSTGSYWRFVENFCETFDNGYGMQIVGITKDASKVEVLSKILQNIMIRNEKKKVLRELPDKIYQQINIKMTSKQARLYDKIKKEILVELEESGELFINSALTRLLRLQQCTSNPELFDLKTNPKFEVIMDILEDCDPDKVVIFSRFSKTINKLEQWLKDKKIKSVKITGDVKDRDKQIKAFIEDNDVRVFLGTIKAVGEGIDGLQNVCDKMIFVDREWSPAVNLQAEDRLHRKGQTKGVQIIDLICEGTIDRYVEKLLNKKIEDIIKLIG
jgi:SNF2 family DNA or RNA helicase